MKHFYLIALTFLLSVSAQSQQFQWAKTFGNTHYEAARGVAADHHGNVYVTGNFFNTVDFDPGSGTHNLTSAGDKDIYFLKLDAFGDLLWAHSMGNAGRESGEAVAVDKQGNVYFTGFFTRTIYPDRNNSSASIHAAVGGHLFVVKLDPSGNLIWAAQTNSTNHNTRITPYDIEIGPNGNVYVSGVVKGTGVIANAYLSGGTSFTTDGNAFLLKLDTLGNYVMHQQMSGSNSSLFHGLAIDQQENIYAAGLIGGQTYYTHPVHGRVNLSTAGRTDIIICRFQANGDYDWLHVMGGGKYDSGNDVALDGHGNLYVTGHFSLTTDFDPDTTSFSLTADGSGQYDLPNIFMARYKVNGDFDWVKQFGRFNRDEGVTIIVDDSSNIYLGGHFELSADFDPGTSVETLFAYGDEETFVAKYDSLGNYIWAEELGGNGIDLGEDMYLDALGNIYATGTFSTNFLYDRSSSNPPFVAAAGGTDFYIAKFVQKVNVVGLESHQNEAFKIYPNPTSENLNIELGNEQFEQLKILDTQGKLVYEQAVSQIKTLQLNIKLKPGIYTVQLINAKGSKHQKILFH